MNFDFKRARKAGHSATEIVDHLKSDKDFAFDIEGARKAGYEDDDIAAYIESQGDAVRKSQGMASRALSAAGEFLSGAVKQTKEDLGFGAGVLDTLERSPKPQDTKPRAWKDVAASPEFKALSLKERSAARAQYFNEVVFPHLPEEERVPAWEQFTKETLRDVMLSARKSTLDKVKGTLAPAANPEPEPSIETLNEQRIAEQPARATMTRKGGVKIAPADLSLQEPPAREADWGEVVKSLPAQFVAGTRHAAANLKRMAGEESVAQREEALKPAQSDPSGWGALVKPSAVERQRKRLDQDREALARASTDAEQATRDIALVTPRDMTTAQEALSALAASSGPTLLGLAAGILTRNVPAAMAIAGGGGAAQQAGSTYGSARGHDATHRQASVAATIDAALEAAGEMLPLSYALKPGTPVFARIFGTMVREAGQEAATQFAQDLRAMAMENPKLTFNEVWHNVKVAALAGAGGGAVYGAVGAAANARGSLPAEGETSRTVADHDLGPQRDPAEQVFEDMLSAEEAQAAQARAAAQEAPPPSIAAPAEVQTPAAAIRTIGGFVHCSPAADETAIAEGLWIIREHQQTRMGSRCRSGARWRRTTSESSAASRFGCPPI